MAGVNSNDVYLLGPDQSKTTGAMKKGAIGATAPTDARTQLGNGWSDAAGYISENGITLNLNRSTSPLKDWGLNTVRVMATDFTTNITGEFLQMDEATANTLFGEDNVSVTAATTTKPATLKLSIGPDMPEEHAFVFNMKDGERRARIYVPNGQITQVGSPTFVPGAGNVWPFTLECYDDGTGHSVNVIFDDGNTTA
jgi:hypothetical protein